MIAPVLDRCPEFSKAMLHVVAEGHSRRLRQILIMMVPNQEIHRHVECELGVVFKSCIIVENEPRYTASIWVSIEPDMSAKRLIAIETAIADRRVRKNGVEQRHQAAA